LENDEEEVEDLRVVDNIEKIFHATYERKTIGAIYNVEASTPVQIQVRVEPTTPCMTNTSTKKAFFREPMTNSQRNIGYQNRSEGTSGSTSRTTSGSSIPNNSTQIAVSREVGTTHSTMTGIDPMIILPEYHGDGT
jgi:hypothetical protein